jgi:hypothetical protein
MKWFQVLKINHDQGPVCLGFSAGFSSWKGRSSNKQGSGKVAFEMMGFWGNQLKAEKLIQSCFSGFWCVGKQYRYYKSKHQNSTSWLFN